MIQQALQKLLSSQDLSRVEMSGVMTEIADGDATPAQVGAFLAALRLKGETVDEIAGAAEVMRARVDPIHVGREIFVDTCGTGGDGRNTFNISTTAAFVVAGAGVTVAKHGNRAVSSRSGSADVLGALGVNVDAPKEVVERCIAEIGIGFLFAPRLHPAFKAVAGIRRELGVRTVFNLLGPLANPAGARYQVLGVYEPRWVPIVGGVLAALGAVRAFVVHGEGLDEIAITGMTHVCEVKGPVTERYAILPEDIGLRRIPRRRSRAATPTGTPASSATSSPASPARRATRSSRTPRRRSCAPAPRPTSESGVRVAAESIDRGAASEMLSRLIAATTVPA